MKKYFFYCFVLFPLHAISQQQWTIAIGDDYQSLNFDPTTNSGLQRITRVKSSPVVKALTRTLPPDAAVTVAKFHDAASFARVVNKSENVLLLTHGNPEGILLDIDRRAIIPNWLYARIVSDSRKLKSMIHLDCFGAIRAVIDQHLGVRSAGAEHYLYMVQFKKAVEVFFSGVGRRIRVQFGLQTDNMIVRYFPPLGKLPLDHFEFRALMARLGEASSRAMRTLHTITPLTDAIVIDQYEKMTPVEGHKKYQEIVDTINSLPQGYKQLYVGLMSLDLALLWPLEQKFRQMS